MLVSSYEVVDIVFCESLVISKAMSYYGAQVFTLHSPKASLPLITSSSLHRTSKEGDILHLLGHFLPTVGAYFTTHDFLFKDEIKRLLFVPHMVLILKKFYSLFS